jgi:penicillin-binding protein 2
MILFAFFAGVLLYRCFNLQIVNGEEYLNDFILQIEKTRDISSTRGRILDRNGNVLAENELAYSVKIEDVFESSRNKNAKVNDVVYRLIKLIEKNGDSVITDFKIIIDEDGDYAYSVDGTALLRFQADVLGYRTIDELSEEEKAMTAQELIEYLSRAKGFAIGQYEDPENTKTPFVPGKGYTKEEWLQMVTIRYAMNLTSFRKYVGTTVATNVSAETVAVIMENSDQLDGVSIVEDTVRHYIDSKYFAHVLGYTGKISSDELAELNDQVVTEGGLEDTYTINDVVGKSGIEAYMETTLQGTKGSEKVVVNNTGKVITILERKEAQPGADVYLTIDKDLTEAVYNIIEQKLAGLVASKIINAKEFNLPENAKSSSIKIPIYDVYFAMINNNILDRKHFEAEDAGETEKAVYAAYLEYKQGVYDRLTYELTEGATPYSKLSKEYQVYQSNIVSLLREEGVIMKELVDDNDATQTAWAKEEVISLKEYLQYCIAMNWIDVSKLDLNDKYSDSTEVYDKLLDYTINAIDHTTEFQKRFYKYRRFIRDIYLREGQDHRETDLYAPV